MGKVEQHTVHVRVRRQDGGEHSAVGAADVDDRSGAIQRQGRDRRALESAGQAGHRGGEPAGLLGVLGQPGEERLAVEAFGGGLAGADGAKEVAERRVVRLHEHDDHIAHRAGLAAGQQLPERVQREDAWLGFGEHAHAGQRAQQPAQRRRVRAGVAARAARCPAGTVTASAAAVRRWPSATAAAAVSFMSATGGPTCTGSRRCPGPGGRPGRAGRRRARRCRPGLPAGSAAGRSARRARRPGRAAARPAGR